jgi:hypothetical protein
MLIDKLVAGVVEVQTAIGPRYVMPSFLQRVYLLWMFRNFPILPHAVLSGRQQRLIDRMCSEQSFASMAYADGLEAPVIGASSGDSATATSASPCGQRIKQHGCGSSPTPLTSAPTHTSRKCELQPCARTVRARLWTIRHSERRYPQVQWDAASERSDPAIRGTIGGCIFAQVADALYILHKGLRKARDFGALQDREFSLYTS